MSTHTPGPWVVTEEGRPYGHVSSNPNGYGDIATTWGNSEANARLIAAAPEMLEALKALLASYEDLGASGDCGFWDLDKIPEFIAARAAIAKAEGQQ